MYRCMHVCMVVCFPACMYVCVLFVIACVHKFAFVLANEVYGDKFTANGVLGLAPSTDGRSIMNALKKDGAINRMVLGINYENPLDVS